MSRKVNFLSQPPGKPDEPYVLSFLGGELIVIPTSVSTMRLLVTGEETKGAFALVGTGGTSADPIGFHYHREAHDVFLCLKGEVNVWANNESRTLTPGDLASVPPGVVHQYQIYSEHTEFIGLIIPGGWEDFFRFIGEPYHGPLFPDKDPRNPFEVLIPRLVAATEKYDMVPVRDHPAVPLMPWKADADNVLPGDRKPYFLKANKGPKWLYGGMLCRPLVTRKESGGRFSIARIEGSSHTGNELFTAAKAIKFKDAHHGIFVAEGKFRVTINGEEVVVVPGETVFVPAGTSFAWSFETVYAAAYFFANGGGVVDVLERIASPCDLHVIPGKSAEVNDRARAKGLEGELGFMMVDA